MDLFAPLSVKAALAKKVPFSSDYAVIKPGSITKSQSVDLQLKILPFYVRQNFIHSGNDFFGKERTNDERRGFEFQATTNTREHKQ